MPIIGFLKIDGISGESLVAAHQDEIDIRGIAWKVHQAASGTGRARGRAEVGGITVLKTCDASSPHLALAAMKGTALARARIAIDRPGEQHFEYLSLKLSDCTVSSYEILPPDPDAAGGAAYLLHERIELSFRKIRILYREQAPDGSPGNEHDVTLDTGN